MKSQILHTVWCCISGGVTGEIWNWPLLGVEAFFCGPHDNITHQFVGVPCNARTHNAKCGEIVCNVLYWNCCNIFCTRTLVIPICSFICVFQFGLVYYLITWRGESSLFLEALLRAVHRTDGVSSFLSSVNRIYRFYQHLYQVVTEPRSSVLVTK